jgi:fructose-bisphosphate aldolase class 1
MDPVGKAAVVEDGTGGIAADEGTGALADALARARFRNPSTSTRKSFDVSSDDPAIVA